MDKHNTIILKHAFKRNEALTQQIQKSSGEELKTAISGISEITGINEHFITLHIDKIKNMTYSTK